MRTNNDETADQTFEYVQRRPKLTFGKFAKLRRQNAIDHTAKGNYAE